MKALNKISTLININKYNRPLTQTLLALQEKILAEKTEEARTALYFSAIKQIASVYKNSSIII